MPYWLLLMYWLSVQQYCQRWGPNYRQFIAGGQAIQNAASTEATAGPPLMHLDIVDDMCIRLCELSSCPTNANESTEPMLFN